MPEAAGCGVPIGSSCLIDFLHVCSLEEDGVLTDCSIKTLEPDEVLDFNFCSTNVVNKIIMKVGSEMLITRTFHDFEVQTEKSVPRVIIWHHKACQVVPKLSGGTDFSV